METLCVSRDVETECLFIHFMIFGLRSGLLIVKFFQRKRNYAGLQVCLLLAAVIRWGPDDSCLGSCSCSDLRVSVNVERLTSPNPSDAIHRSGVAQRRYFKEGSPRCVGVLTFKVTEGEVCTQPATCTSLMTSASTNRFAGSGRACSDVGAEIVMFTYVPFEFKSSSYGRTICVTPSACDSRELYVYLSPFPVLIAVNVSWPIAPYYVYRSVGGDLLWYPRNDSTTFPACEMNWTKVRRLK